MTDRRLLVSAAALVMAGAVLGGCERSPYPEPSRMAEPPVAANAPELMGAPNGHEADREDEAGPRATEAYPSPPEGLQPAPEQAGAAPPYPPALDAYPPTPAPPMFTPFAPARPAPPRIITMEPIPNPPEHARRVHHAYRSHVAAAAAERPISASRRERRARHAESRRHAGVHRQFNALTGRSLHRTTVAPPNVVSRKHLVRPSASDRSAVHPARHAAAPAARAPAPSAAAKPSIKSNASPVTEGKASTAPRQVLPPKPVQVAKPAPALVKPSLPVLRAPTRPDVAPSPAAKHAKVQHGREVTGRTPSAAPTAEAASKLSALSAALGPVIASRAVLKGVEGLKTGAPGDVSLSVPPDFGDGLRNEAKRSGMAESATSAAVTAKLTGDGYAVSPSEAQSQPLMSGKATDFRWTVTKMEAARGPLQAEIGADLLGGGKQHLDFGAITGKAPAGFRLSPRALGVGLLLLVVILAGALMSGGRRSREPDAVPPDSRT